MRVLAGLLFLAASAAAQAGWSVSADLEGFQWEEDGTPSVTEKGARYGFSWSYLRERDVGWQFAYRGQFRRGTVDYDGALLFDPNQPVTARTRYTGLLNEGQAIYRLPKPIGFELVGGLGYDYWERLILPDQREDYSVVFARLGVNFDPRNPRGWFGGGGVKLPFYVSENAHLNELGFSQNPKLEPEGAVSVYAQAGYRFSRSWSLIGYLDSYRFRPSSTVSVTSSDTSICTPQVPPCTFQVFQPGSTLQTFGARLQYDFP
jgi:hypothetical protein